MTPGQHETMRQIIEPSYEEQMVPDMVLEAKWLLAQATTSTTGAVVLPTRSAERVAESPWHLAREIQREHRA